VAQLFGCGTAVALLVVGSDRAQSIGLHLPMEASGQGTRQTRTCDSAAPDDERAGLPFLGEVSGGRIARDERGNPAIG
jgi:hypothetical protein